jgi:hypothetical protein
MFKLIGFLVVLIGIFVLGFYAGQHRITDLHETVTAFSKQALGTTFGLGIERNLEWRASLVDAKASVVQAKSELIERNYGNATVELSRALESIQDATRTEHDPDRIASAKSVAAKVRKTKVRMASGKVVPRAQLDEIQQDLDTLLGK